MSTPQTRKELLPTMALRSHSIDTFALCWANSELAHVTVWSCTEIRTVASFMGATNIVAAALASQVPGSPIVCAPMSALPESIDQATNTQATLTDVVVVGGLRAGVRPVDMPNRGAIDGLVGATADTVLPEESDPVLFPVGAVQVLERAYTHIGHAIEFVADRHKVNPTWN